MDLLTAESPNNGVSLTIGDGLGTFDMPKNVVKLLQSKEDAFFVDAVVRQAVRETRRNGRLGEALRVEVIVGAGVTRNGDQERVWSDSLLFFLRIPSRRTPVTWQLLVSARWAATTGTRPVI